MLCRVLEVSASGYYAWLKRPQSKRKRDDVALAAQITAIFKKSKRTYGRPRMHAELREAGVCVSSKRIARLMRENDQKGISRRRRYRKGGRGSLIAPDLVRRNFRASAPNELWVADITYVPTDTTYVFLAVVLDVYSRRIVGWAMENHLRAELVLNALNMAIRSRSPHHVIHHSDQGTQYTSIEFGARCAAAGVELSMGRVGDCYDNAMCESFFATLECELFAQTKFENPAQAELAIFNFIEGWYNPHRRHSSIAYLSPINFERRTAASLVSNP